MPNAGPRRLLGDEAPEKFKRVEALIVGIASLAILATAVISFVKSSSFPELVGQVLIIPVLLASVRYGRAGAVLSAAAATFVYEIARYPDLGDVISYMQALELVGVRSLGYLLVGLVGSEAMRWSKYYLVKAGGLDGVDFVSGVYSPDFIRAMIKREIEIYERYSSPFSVVVVEVDLKGLPKRGVFGRERALKELGSLIKNNVRLVDEVGRLDEKRFAILLPRTEPSGAGAVAKRIEDLISKRFSAKRGIGITVKAHSVPEQLVELRALAGIKAPSADKETNK